MLKLKPIYTDDYPKPDDIEEIDDDENDDDNDDEYDEEYEKEYEEYQKHLAQLAISKSIDIKIQDNKKQDIKVNKITNIENTQKPISQRKFNPRLEPYNDYIKKQKNINEFIFNNDEFPTL